MKTFRHISASHYGQTLTSEKKEVKNQFVGFRFRFQRDGSLIISLPTRVFKIAPSEITNK